MGLFLLAACQLENPQQESVVTNTPTLSTMVETPNMMINDYPSTPEEVIRAFIITYPTDPLSAILYLSPSYVSKLDAASASNLLPATGDVTGFIIEKGSVSAESELSQILANIAFENMSSLVQFDLEIVDGRWVINKITAK
jgi:hypothetical protein